MKIMKNIPVFILAALLVFSVKLKAQVATDGESNAAGMNGDFHLDTITSRTGISPDVKAPGGITAMPVSSGTVSAGMMVDRIVAVIGSQIVKESDVANGLDQFRSAGLPVTDSVRGAVVDQLLFKKLLVQQANHDSVTVTESEINGETDRRMRYFLMQFKSDKDFEQFYGKTVDAFKFELHDQVKELLLAQRMQASITQSVLISPAEVNAWFNSRPADSLPFINSQVEIGQIIIVPPVNQELKENTRETLLDIRQQILLGKLTFCAAAAAYSKDPGSANNCGQYENVRRGTFVPEFDAVCFSLKEGEISMPFETEYGFHIVKLIARRGEEVTIQHILLDIPASPDDLRACKVRLDSVLRLIRLDSLDFCGAAAKYSQDDETKYSCGLMVNPETGTTRIDVDQLGQYDPDPQFPIIINNMKVGQMSAPQPCMTRNGKQGYRILYLKSRSQPHRANLKDDYQLIQDLALQEKQNKALDAWVRKKLSTTYVRIDADYRRYNYHYPWLQYMQ